MRVLSNARLRINNQVLFESVSSSFDATFVCITNVTLPTNALVPIHIDYGNAPNTEVSNSRIAERAMPALQDDNIILHHYANSSCSCMPRLQLLACHMMLTACDADFDPPTVRHPHQLRRDCLQAQETISRGHLHV